MMFCPVSVVLGFADDIVLVGKNLNSPLALFTMAQTKFMELGLTLNVQKTKMLHICKGKLLLHWNFIIILNLYLKIRK